MSKLLNRITVFCLTALMIIGAAAVSAGTAQVSGTLDGSSPIMDVVSISTPNCGAQVPTSVSYAIHPFTVDADGVYNFRLNIISGMPSFYVYINSFDPANGEVNCQNASNYDEGGYKEFNSNLTAGTQYILVVIDDAFEQLGASYTAIISGPGNIFFAGAGAEACRFPLPAGSFQQNVPLGAPTYYDADPGTLLNFELPAGNWWVSEISGDFARVWIACQANPVWIPTSAIGG